MFVSDMVVFVVTRDLTATNQPSDRTSIQQKRKQAASLSLAAMWQTSLSWIHCTYHHYVAAISTATSLVIVSLLWRRLEPL